MLLHPLHEAASFKNLGMVHIPMQSVLLTSSEVYVGLWVFCITSFISVVLWLSVLLVKKIRNSYKPSASHKQDLSHEVVSSTPH
jgi:hypothetical protein